VHALLARLIGLLALFDALSLPSVFSIDVLCALGVLQNFGYFVNCSIGILAVLRFGCFRRGASQVCNSDFMHVSGASMPLPLARAGIGFGSTR